MRVAGVHALGEAEETEAPPHAASRSRLVVAGAIAGGIIVVGLGAAWIERAPIVADFADRALADRHVRARYRIAAVGPFAQRLENVSIGDPANPDLTAKSVDIRLGYDLHGPHLVAVSGDGVRLHGKLVDGKLSLGAVDRLLPAPSGNQTIGLPDIDVTLTDTIATLQTPAGRIVADLYGTGRLSDGFSGHARLAAPRLAVGGCTLASPRADVRVQVSDHRPQLTGPIALAGIACPNLRLAPGRVEADLTFAAGLDRWRGELTVDGFPGRVGALRFGALGGRLTTAGDMKRAESETHLSLASLAFAEASARDVRADGRFRYSPGPTGLVYAGELSAPHASADLALRNRLRPSATAADATPLGPVARRAAEAAATALADAKVAAQVALTTGGAAGTVARVKRLDAVSASGAKVRIDGGGGFGWNVAAKGWRADGQVALHGGGLPDIVMTLDQPRAGAAVSGIARMAPYAAGDARLALAPVRFKGGRETRFSTRATIDGPLGSGSIEGLSLPFAGRIAGGTVTVDEACMPIGFRSLRISGMTLDSARLRVCGIDGGAILSARNGKVRAGASTDDVRLPGRAGSAPLTLSASHVTVDMAGLAVTDLAARIGRPDAVTRLNFGRIEGGFSNGGVGGDFAGGGGQIGNVPLILSAMDGRWRLADGRLTMAGDLTVTDAQTGAPRFRPVAGHDVVLTLDGGRILTTGVVAEPTTGARVADVRVRHDLGTGIGDALLDVPGITFAKGLQPDMLTPLTLGVIANVAGTLSGEGWIAWGNDGVRSSGDFKTDRIDLAAAFGPVTGIRGHIHFSDLLGLVTPPHQTATIAEINPGIAVSNGVVDYRLLPDQRIRIEGARWPFAGGTLTLDPTILAFGQDAVRRMTFRIRGLDAAAFVGQLSLPNLAATGNFDGVLPMAFDQSGGRIADGHIAARPPGGTIAYVGELSRQKLGTMGKLAFDALKAIRYSSLAIDLDGRIDGEIVSRVTFTGVRQATPDASLAARLIRGLPFRFNIVIRAPFRALLGTARSYADPSLLLPQAGTRAAVTTAPPVQPSASEPVR